MHPWNDARVTQWYNDQFIAKVEEVHCHQLKLPGIVCSKNIVSNVLLVLLVGEE